jgi:hypothetical protein
LNNIQKHYINQKMDKSILDKINKLTIIVEKRLGSLGR